VHRDVKPENVLVRLRRDPAEPDHALLCDFGVAKLESADLALTRAGAFVGTVNYASPEQTRSERLDGRSDQYSLACVLFECLTGAPPFSAASSEEVMAAHREAPRPSASERRRDLVPALDEVLARGMAVRPRDRHATCRELVAAARRATRTAEPEPEPTIAGEAPAPPARRRPRLRAWAVAILALAAAGAVAALVLADGSAPATSERAIRETVAAYAAAEGEEELCPTLSSGARPGCLQRAQTARPTEYEVRRVVIADGVAQVEAVQAEFGDPLELELVLEGDEWLVDEEPAVGWKDPDEVEIAAAVARFGARDPEACDLLTAAIADQCEDILPPAPVTYDFQTVSVAAATAFVSARLDATTVDSYGLVATPAGWRIERVNE
jgi:Protein kinase domain